MNWKKLGFGLGGLFLSGAALGSTVFFARKKPETALTPYWIPEQPEPFSILTEPMERVHNGRKLRSHLEYVCQPTQFRLWNLIDVELYRMQRQGGPDIGSHPIFHVVVKVHLQPPDGAGGTIEDDRFYATIHTHRGKSATTLASCVQPGRYVEFRKCYVGGGLNGIETGERVVSMAPVREIRALSAT